MNKRVNVMFGKILRISSSDLYGNVDERQVVVFACFIYKKYMNRYIIFTFKNEYNKKKLYYGSIHLKENSLVVFGVRDEEYKYVDNFINSYLSSSVSTLEYELIDLSKMEKIELVSYKEMDFERLEDLDRLSIPLTKVSDDSEEKKPVFLYLLLVILFLLLGGITYLYLNPNVFIVQYKKLSCEMNDYNEKLEMKYVIKRDLTFTKKDKIKSYKGIDIYTFLDRDSYNEFKEGNMQDEYFNIKGTYKYNDEDLTLRILYDEKTIIEDYQEILEYLRKEGYTCEEGSYYE